MNKELIKDSRLTPTMERVRSGRTQLFREKDNNRSFISDENCGVSLKHENKEMYAKLIDNKWYWVNGCQECNGNARSSTKSYIECVKHDVCVSCGISRKEIKDYVMGGLNGWTCKPCHESKMEEIRRKAFEELDGEEPDCSYVDEIICPHCGSIIGSDDIHESQDLECHVCDGELHLEVDYSVSYTTSVIGTRIKF